MPALSHQGRTAMPSVLALLLAMSIVGVWPGASAAAPVGDAGPVLVQRTQELALLNGPHRAMSAPDTHSVALQLVSGRRPITDEQTALPVIGHKTAAQRV